MKKFTKITSTITPFDKANVDTDQIIPKQFLKLVQKTGFGKYLFYNWRFDTDGNPKKDFILNESKYSDSQILVTNENFGCGSSREHAPIALSTCGIKAVLAISFARIFYRNSVDGAFLLPIEIDEKTYQSISNNDDLEINIDQNEIKNLSKNQIYTMKPFSEIIAKIISAGGLFKYSK